MPNSAFWPPPYVTNDSRLPFVSVSVGSSTTPFVAIPTASIQIPFSTQAANVVTYAIDSVQLDFIQTEAPLNIKGRLSTTFFY